MSDFLEDMRGLLIPIDKQVKVANMIDSGAAEARSTLLAEVLAVVDERIAHNDDLWRNGAHIQDNAKALERKRELNAIRTRLAALNNQTEKQDG